MMNNCILFIFSKNQSFKIQDKSLQLPLTISLISQSKTLSSLHVSLTAFENHILVTLLQDLKFYVYNSELIEEKYYFEIEYLDVNGVKKVWVGIFYRSRSPVLCNSSMSWRLDRGSIRPYSLSHLFLRFITL